MSVQCSLLTAIRQIVILFRWINSVSSQDPKQEILLEILPHSCDEIKAKVPSVLLRKARAFGRSPTGDGHQQVNAGHVRHVPAIRPDWRFEWSPNGRAVLAHFADCDWRSGINNLPCQQEHEWFTTRASPRTFELFIQDAHRQLVARTACA